MSPIDLLERPRPTDADLLRAVARGEREALGELYDRLAPQMLALARRMLGAQREAEDVIHDVFLEVWQRAAYYDHERAKVSTWLLLRVRSRALDRLRRDHRLDTVELSESSPQSTPMDPREDDGLDAGRNGRALHLVMADLPDEQRRVLELGFFAGYTYEEIAAKLAIPVGTVKSRAARAIARLRLRLQAKVGVER